MLNDKVFVKKKLKRFINKLSGHISNIKKQKLLQLILNYKKIKIYEQNNGI